MAHSRRFMLVGATACAAVPFGARSTRAQDVTIKVGALRTIAAIAEYMYDRFSPPGVKIEVLPIESPTECKNAVVTKSVDVSSFGVAAGILGAAAGEPVVIVGASCDRGMGIVVRKDLPVDKIADLKGRKVGIWPGSTQEVFMAERLRMEGLDMRDIQRVRVSFSEMATALARGDIDAYVGAEPAPALSLVSGVGKIVEYPYSTAMGSLNVIMGVHRDTIEQRPDLVRAILKIHRHASEFAMANRQATVDTAIAKLGMNRAAVEASLPNIDLNWQLTPDLIQRTRVYAEHMLAMKQIRAMPDFKALFNTSFSDELARTI